MSGRSRNGYIRNITRATECRMGEGSDLPPLQKLLCTSIKDQKEGAFFF